MTKTMLRELRVRGSEIVKKATLTVGATAGRLSMADTPKLSVEKALEKLRKSDPKSKNERYDEEMSELDEEIKRMRAQRLRLERDQRKRD